MEDQKNGTTAGAAKDLDQITIFCKIGGNWEILMLLVRMILRQIII